jgi:hypothetical protein
VVLEDPAADPDLAGVGDGQAGEWSTRHPFDVCQKVISRR